MISKSSKLGIERRPEGEYQRETNSYRIKIRQNEIQGNKERTMKNGYIDNKYNH